MRNFKLLPLLTGIFFAVILGLPGHEIVLAQDPETPSVALSVSPAIIDTGGNAGSEVPFTFSVTNRSGFVLPFHLSSRSMSGRIGDVDRFLQTNNAQSWLVFGEPDFLLGPDQTKHVNGSLVIPEDAGPGGHYADILVRPLSQIGTTDAVHAQPELAVRLLARVSGKTVEDVEAKPEGSRFIMTSRPSSQKVSFTLKNNGNVHELISPALHLKQGEKIITSIGSEPTLLLPRESKTFSFALPEKMSLGVYTMGLEYTYASPPKTVLAPGYRLVIFPFPAAYLWLVPIGIGAYLLWRYHKRLLLAVRILLKGQSKK